MSKSREQILIDIAFAIAYHVKYYHSDKMTTEETMSWVAEQLRSMGFDTEPRGVSWGILKETSELQFNRFQK